MQQRETSTGSSPDPFRIIFADGTRYWARPAKVSEFVLHPSVMQFVLLCVLQNSILQWRSEFPLVTGWTYGFLWLVLAVTVLTWIYFVCTIAMVLIRRRIIALFYTPFMSVSLVLVTESVTRIFVSHLTGADTLTLWNVFSSAARDIVVVLLYDIMFARFVATHHPLLMAEPPQAPPSQPSSIPPSPPRPVPAGNDVPATRSPELPPQPSSPPRPEGATAVPGLLAGRPANGSGATDDDPDSFGALRDAPPGRAELPRSETIVLGGELLHPSEILSVHSEDHYLRVQLQDSHLLLRGRFVDILAQLPAESGLQISRSEWVSRRRMLRFNRTGDYRLFLVMTDGETRPVARSRCKAALEFARSFGLPVQRTDT